MPRFAKGSKEAKEYMASIRKGKGKSKGCDCCGKCTCVSGGMMPVTMPRQDLDTTDKVLDGVREALRARLAQATPMGRATQGSLMNSKQASKLDAKNISYMGMTTPAEGFSMYPNPPSRMPIAQEPAEMSGGGMECVDCKSCRGMGVIAIKKYLKR
jgi:hypothetical protein